ncbi:Gluconokinase [Streptomyces sp. RB5]|uniref:Gluconokinase n=1 Tax=Streptomyces smaragdinus TaxID=2585196 RepID=A0A7K0CSY2_9ACTN|nr:gluconokinase [Streptomyces smaragdinus]MQY16473.1 Gluconokinase [Streptomyces smaragdinus]
MRDKQPVVVVMGVSGTGKTTVGALLADRLGVPYGEADSFHPAANITKMKSSEPLDDTDREPWLDAIGAWAHAHRAGGGVVSCSALKRAYRDRLRAAEPELYFVHLAGDRSLIAGRLTARAGHFMPPALLDSQLAALEPLQDDEHGISISVDDGPEALADRAAAAVREETGY